MPMFMVRCGFVFSSTAERHYGQTENCFSVTALLKAQAGFDVPCAFGAYRIAREAARHRLSDVLPARCTEKQRYDECSRLWLNIGPALLFQLHHPHDAGLDHFSLGDNRDVLVLSLPHVLLGVAAGLE